MWKPKADRRGSSPLTRGKRGLIHPPLNHVRLIPAHAGKTPDTRRAGTSTTAHPRSRGENRSNVGPGVFVAGSSPLTRGKLTIKRR